jgi:SPP1 family predicted phage head-tail adaptor
MTVRAGTLRHKVTIQQLTTTGTDGDGQPIESWSDLTTVWASIEPLRGREFFEARAQLSEETVRFRMRYQSTISNTRHRLVFGSETYRIESVIEPQRRNEMLEIIATRYRGV